MCHGNELVFEYDVDVSKTPEHLANFMFCLIMSDALSWNEGSVVFNEMTSKELDCIRRNLVMNFHSKGCGGLFAGHRKIFPRSLKLKVKVKNIVSEEEVGGEGPVLCANGLGKDGLTVANMVKELGFDMRCFFVTGQMTPNIRRERINNINEFYRKRSIESNIIGGNFFSVKAGSQGFHPYFHAIPLAHHYKSEAILSGISIHLNKTRIIDNALHCPGESIFSFDYASKASGIKFSSPHSPLALPGIQQLLVERYGDSLKHQRSCNRGSPWCNNCAKCHRHNLYISTMGIDPSTLGLKISGVEDIYNGSTVTQSAYGREASACLNKLAGEHYEKWVFGASKPVLDLIWKGREFEGIFKEHFDLYDYDPGSDGGGWTLNPSLWRKWLDDGLVELYGDNQK